MQRCRRITSLCHKKPVVVSVFVGDPGESTDDDDDDDDFPWCELLDISFTKLRTVAEHIEFRFESLLVRV